MKDTNIIIRISESSKSEFKIICDKNNVKVSSVLSGFINEVNKKGKIPLNVLTNVDEKEKPQNISLIDLKNAVMDYFDRDTKFRSYSVYVYGDLVDGSNKVNKKINLRVDGENIDNEEISYMKKYFKLKLKHRVDVLSTKDFNEEELLDLKNKEVKIC